MIQNNYYPSQDPILKLRQEMKLRKFSQKTIKSYLYYITNFLNFTNKGPRNINTEDIREYLEKRNGHKIYSGTLGAQKIGNYSGLYESHIAKFKKYRKSIG